MSIRVVLADDHAVVRDGIRALISKKEKNIEVVGEAANGREFLALAESVQADVYVVDISMPVMNGLVAAEKLLKKDPEAKIIILSMHDNIKLLERAMRCGVKGYLLKEGRTEELLQAIHMVHEGKFFLSHKISGHIVRGFLGKGVGNRGLARPVELTPREREVLQLISEGNTTGEIARQLCLAGNTVRVHRNNIMQKLGLHKQANLIRYALKEGISQL